MLVRSAFVVVVVVFFFFFLGAPCDRDTDRERGADGGGEAVGVARDGAWLARPPHRVAQVRGRGVLLKPCHYSAVGERVMPL